MGMPARPMGQMPMRPQMPVPPQYGQFGMQMPMPPPVPQHGQYAAMQMHMRHHAERDST